MAFNTLFRTTCSLFLLLLGTIGRAQEAEGELVYKFAVQGISEPVAAKAIQAALLQHADTRLCLFVDEADVFALYTPMLLDFHTLTARLGSAGHSLQGPVRVSNGATLQPSGVSKEQ